jgi:type IV pilus assembly protein PilX
MTSFRRTPHFGTRQHGAVLFIALVMLVLLTLIGITAMQVTLLQERMAGGFRVQHQAFEAAEGTLKDQRQTLNNDAAASGPSYYSPDAVLITDNALPWSTWVNAEPSTTPSTQVNAHISVGSPPAVLGARQLKYFVVSALNDDPSGDAKAAVQAVFLF